MLWFSVSRNPPCFVFYKVGHRAVLTECAQGLELNTSTLKGRKVKTVGQTAQQTFNEKAEQSPFFLCLPSVSKIDEKIYIKITQY